MAAISISNLVTNNLHGVPDKSISVLFAEVIGVFQLPRIYDNSTMSRKKRTLGLENYYTTSNELVLLRIEKLISVNKQMFNDGREDSQQYKDEYKKLMSLDPSN